MKKILISSIMILLVIGSQSFTYATSSDTWVKDAFSASSTFLNETTKDTIGIKPAFELFQNLIKTVNRVLLIALAGISVIALSVTGIKYILEGGGVNPQRRGEAKNSLKTIFIGMLIGFGAFTIWNIAISVVKLIMQSFAQS